ncbi:ISP domain-containing protein [Rickenella mellea]|uniref:Choline monooxygenase, chloroplastic n=1 Tax=Rickenella mellea TaxID=50990 RepID=A0A4Y7PK33_9AGAM|nr:ISP domain-containing protein [Rickenella mellea]
MAPALDCSLPVETQRPNGNKHLEPRKTLPARWYRDEKVFQLEKRAIFSKLWLLASYTSRFEKPGDYISGNYVYDYFIIRDRDDHYQAFHNVCRHRAFPVITKYSGSSLVVGCKYHGWSYNTRGDLVKAPKFENVPGFDKTENGLFKVHTHVTPQGFIFLNFDASPNPVPFEEHFGQLPSEWTGFNSDDYEYSYSWQARGDYNWKTLMDGYQECYHCTIGHPGFAKSLDLNEYRVTPLTNAARHEVPNATSRQDSEAAPVDTGVTVTDVMWYTMRTVPISATQTRMEYDVFKRKSVQDHDLRDYMKFYEQVEQEDFDLCTATQRGLNSGVYSKGIPYEVPSVYFAHDVCHGRT